MTERLEEIKEAYRWTIDNSLVPRLSDSDTEWLIEQVERVQDLKIMLKVLREENQRYKHALEFYANKENYAPDFVHNVENDEGQIARQALEGKS